MTANDDDNPHYDDLIKELGELKKFIESNGDNVPAAQTREDSRNDEDAAEQAGQAPPSPAYAGDDDDEPPTLREAVRRPPRRDEMQLDLLSVSRHDEEVADERDAPVDEEFDETGATTPDHDASPGGAVEASGFSTEPPPARGDEEPPAFPSLPEEPDDGTYDEDSDDEVVRFVLDLSDRILGTIEDKLLAHSGELLPNEVRGELREAIGDILYEWCER